MGRPCFCECVELKWLQTNVAARRNGSLAASARQRGIEPYPWHGLNLVFDVPESCSVVLDKALDGRIGPPVEHGIHDPAVLLQGVAVAMRGRHRNEPVALRLIHQVLADPDQDRGAAGGDKGKMEGPVRSSQAGLVLASCSDSFHGVRERWKGHDDVLLPGLVAIPDRLLQGLAFQPAPGFHQLTPAFDAHRRYEEAALILALDEPFGGETVESLTDRVEAGAISLGHEVDQELLPRSQPAIEDVLASRLS